ncbi:hypothetical protein AK830_g8525 [Neonectria ditissima]|uniref:Homeobox protein 4 n=1 Tax=Neonectria ditissima TaxID=78410 RepID=A0A0P7AU68_9HYPO|nr:hypothetical protein AK830_g8525 [Neonectria ditissima]
MPSTHLEAEEAGGEKASTFAPELGISPGTGDSFFADLPLDSISTGLTDTLDYNYFGFEQLFNQDSSDANFIPSRSSSSLLLPMPASLTSNNFTAETTSTPSESMDVFSTEIEPPTHDLSSERLPSKIGARFSRDAVSILRQWLSANNERPYPNEDEKEMLQRKTGLNKTQIANWFANARRRAMAQHRPRSIESQTTQSSTRPVEIPRRPGTPTAGSRNRHLNPLDRWVDSPPEDEPATATAIARAIGSGHSTGIGDDYNIRAMRHASDGSLNASSTGTSNSSANSFSSAHSCGSRGPSRASTGSRSPSTSGILGNSRTRFKKRPGKRRRNITRSLGTPLNRFQCTFCTETFKTKHDWQRHEKSLHIPLERWTCAPNGPVIVCEHSNESYCAFCGELDPDAPHVTSHNPSLCQERTFSRKDHLKQHLRLVHNTTLVESLTENWKVPLLQVRSRCGFCGISIDTWEFRTNHLADHFKMGQTMAAWKGDWGFDVDVLKMVENSIPPYLIDSDRKTPDPYMASRAPIGSPRHAYELIQSELIWFLQNHVHETGDIPGYEMLQLEACRIIFAAEAIMLNETNTGPNPASWLRDLITSREDIAQKAQFGPIRSHAESALFVPKLHGKKSLFEACPLEAQLRDFVRVRWFLDHNVLSSSELQVEACRIISGIAQEFAALRYNAVSNWLIMLIGSSTDWLASFRKRAYDSVDQSGQRTELEAGNMALQDCRMSYVGAPDHVEGYRNATQDDCTAMDSLNSHGHLSTAAIQQMPSDIPRALRTTDPDHRPPWVLTKLFFLNDANFHRWQAMELGRWVLATMSPNNPNRHTPSDEELRHQARCILYDDDDPLNPTAADNAKWLRHFKRDFNIPDESSLDKGHEITNAIN